MIELFAWFIIFDAVFCLTLVCYLIYTKIKRKNKMVLDKEAEPEVKRRSSENFAKLFDTGQYGRYFVVSGAHVDDPYLFLIQLLPEGVHVEVEFYLELCKHIDAVQVYGFIAHDPFFGPHYGWLHQGPWVEDFEKLADEQEAKIRKKKAEEDARLKEQKKIQDDHDQKLLALYSSNWKPIN